MHSSQDGSDIVADRCSAIQTQITQNSVRGQISVQEPSANNGWRGELRLSDPYMGADVFDFTITLYSARMLYAVWTALLR